MGNRLFIVFSIGWALLFGAFAFLGATTLGSARIGLPIGAIAGVVVFATLTREVIEF